MKWRSDRPAQEMESIPARRPHVVILGAGFGGLNAAQGLRNAPVDVTVVDRRNYHLFQPLLYQVATAALSPAQIAMPIRRILARQKNATVLMEKIDGIDAQARLVITESRRIAYDYLVIATGARHAYFGHDEWAETAPGLKTIGDATEIRAPHPDGLRRGRSERRPGYCAASCSPSSSSAADRPASSSPAPSSSWRARPSSATSAASIPRPRA